MPSIPNIKYTLHQLHHLHSPDAAVSLCRRHGGDGNFIASEEIKKILGSKALVLNALRHEEHVSHYTLAQAIEVAEEVGADNTYFTHISHQLGLHTEVEARLPKACIWPMTG